MFTKSLGFFVSLQLLFYVCKILILDRVGFLSVFINTLSAAFRGSEKENKSFLSILQSSPFCILFMNVSDLQSNKQLIPI